jgi:23S rRNA (guanosine2251-2'-O)-methyltransferase
MQDPGWAPKWSRGDLRESIFSCIYGIHPVLECLKTDSRAIERIYLSQGVGGRGLQEIIDLARSKGVSIKFEPRFALDRKTGNAVHQGVVAVCGTCGYVDLEDILDYLGQAALLVLLDSVEDPRNLGAILRSCAFFGVDGIIIPKDKAAGLSPTVAKTAEGALEHLRIARVTNLARTIDDLKKKGIWVVGIESGQEILCDQVDFDVPIALVFGNEGQGLRRLTREKCDVLASIPSIGLIHSLNVSVAAGIALYEVARTRRIRGRQS